MLRHPKTHDPIAYGTGFFVGVQANDKKFTYGYLVTAKHVRKEMSEQRCADRARDKPDRVDAKGLQGLASVRVRS